MKQILMERLLEVVNMRLRDVVAPRLLPLLQRESLIRIVEVLRKIYGPPEVTETGRVTVDLSVKPLVRVRIQRADLDLARKVYENRDRYGVVLSVAPISRENMLAEVVMTEHGYDLVVRVLTRGGAVIYPDTLIYRMYWREPITYKLYVYVQERQQEQK